jgi:uncharacterized protein YraI
MQKYFEKLNNTSMLKGCVLLSMMGFTTQAFAYSPADLTANYRDCLNVSSPWDGFGRFGAGCDAAAMTSTDLNNRFGPIIFDDLATDRTTERRRYMQEAHAWLRDATQYYIQSRKSATAAEVAAFQRGVFAMTQQESFWTHYRKATDNRIKYIRGDYADRNDGYTGNHYYGHGMFQVDTNSHAPALNDGKGMDWAKHFLYAMDAVFYVKWQEAANQSCVTNYAFGTAEYWRARARTAWSAYNSGSNYCRWTTGFTADSDFVSKYDTQPWLSYISNASATAARAVPCLVKGGTSCGTPTTPPPTTTPAATINVGAGSSLNKRTGPSTDYGINGAVAHGTAVAIQCKITGESINGNSTWSKIGTGQFVANAFLLTNSVTPPNCTFPQGTVRPNANGSGYTLNIRKGPSTSYEIVGSISSGTKKNIYCQQSGSTIYTHINKTSKLWSKIADGQYIADAYLDTPLSPVAHACY